MKTFHDSAGRTWTVAANVDALKRVRSLCEVDLLDAVQDGGTLLEKLTHDPVLLCDVIFAVCKEEADAKSISDVDFGKAMAGDPIEEATAALLEELVDFFPRPRREVLRKVLDKLKKLEGMTLAAATKVLDSEDLENLMAAELEDNDLAAAIKKRLAELRSAGSSSTSSPEPPASGPDR